MCIKLKKYFANYVQKVKDIKCEEESKDVFHSGFRTDIRDINKSKMSFLVVQLV